MRRITAKVTAEGSPQPQRRTGEQEHGGAAAAGRKDKQDEQAMSLAAGHAVLLQRGAAAHCGASCGAAAASVGALPSATWILLATTVSAPS